MSASSVMPLGVQHLSQNTGIQNMTKFCLQFCVLFGNTDHLESEKQQLRAHDNEDQPQKYKD